MSTLEEKFKEACDVLDIPGAVIVAADKTGNFEYKEAFGTSTLKDSSKPLALDSTFWIASCTKLMTTICAMQCVERGQLNLDNDVSPILHEYKDAEIITGFEEDKPILKKAEKKITLRHLLTHSSGIGYDVFNPTLAKWRVSRGEPLAMSGMPLLDRCLTPLLFEPGTSWEYGTGIDWAGVMVSRVNNGMNLQDYMKKNLWEPLGIKDMTFHLDQSPEIKERLSAMSKREGDVHPIFGVTLNPTGKVEWTPGMMWPDIIPVGDEFGGAGGIASATDYLKILRSICANDGRLLKPATVDEMFKAQLSEGSKQTWMGIKSIPEMNDCMGGLPKGANADWGIGGLLMLEDLPTGRKKGSLAWGGLPNLTWWIDREGGLCGLYASQVLPQGDPKSNRMHQMFETAMYERMKKESRL